MDTPTEVVFLDLDALAYREAHLQIKYFANHSLQCKQSANNKDLS